MAVVFVPGSDPRPLITPSRLRVISSPDCPICLLRARHRRNTKASCNRLDNLGMTSLQAPRIRRLTQERHPTMPTCSMPISSGWPVRLGSPSLGVALTAIGTVGLATATTPLATGQEEAHQVLQEDPSMALLCLEQTMQQWDTATTAAGTGARQRTLPPEE